ncbi:M48 family metallopeptidase [Niveibacterium sp. 24ML]|uniref:M48 family metallopeptidase n=1 Tax=Niveibacterium sp. 24ML TaxID=2985512 RepID=UPI00226FFD3A|nr:M48 family metallopeptidase [Niveibacterium sp. 24ML]MCX9157087.1 M48 family metallopeptidase [Niveibacterium sp. 24ML]
MLRPLASIFAALLLWVAPAMAADGVTVDEASRLRKLVPAEQLEQSAGQQYREMLAQAAAKRALAPEGSPALRRLRGIAQRIIPYSARFNPRAQQWKWEVNLIASKDANAFCMPGGKIAFFTGLIDGLKLSDDEIAIVMGHEIAHALREHARERIAKTQLTQLGVGLLGQFIGDGKYTEVFSAGGNLLTLKFSRQDESDADVVGLDLAARAGYNPQAGISLWKKMEKAGGSGGFAWLSTHPAGKDRIREIERRLPEVMPLYERARSSTTTKG